MIAAETTSAAAIIFPFRGGSLTAFIAMLASHHNVARRAHFGALAAMDAHVLIDCELPVGNHVAVEVAADNV